MTMTIDDLKKKKIQVESAIKNFITMELQCFQDATKVTVNNITFSTYHNLHIGRKYSEIVVSDVSLDLKL